MKYELDFDVGVEQNMVSYFSQLDYLSQRYEVVTKKSRVQKCPYVICLGVWLLTFLVYCKVLLGNLSNSVLSHYTVHEPLQ